MSENKFQNRFRIPSARAAWHNYNGGTDFVTICTQGREHYFGEITSEYDWNVPVPDWNGTLGRSTDVVRECVKSPKKGIFEFVTN